MEGSGTYPKLKNKEDEQGRTPFKECNPHIHKRKQINGWVKRPTPKQIDHTRIHQQEV